MINMNIFETKCIYNPSSSLTVTEFNKNTDVLVLAIKGTNQKMLGLSMDRKTVKELIRYLNEQL